MIKFSPNLGFGKKSGLFRGAWETWGKGLSLCGILAWVWVFMSLSSGLAQAVEKRPHIPIRGGIGNKTCYECHIKGTGIRLPSEERPKMYSMAQAFETFLQSPHGRLRLLGDERAPMCEDCHGTREWKDILPQSHPDSPIHPKNLPRVCAKCHGEGMFQSNVTEGAMHLELMERSLVPGKPLAVRYGFLPGITKSEKAYYIGLFDFTAYISWFFLVLTLGTLSLFSLYVFVDLIRKVLERLPGSLREKNHEEE